MSLFIFYILSYLPSKTLGCFSGRLMSPASDQKLFCEFAQRSIVFQMNLWGRKWSPRPVPPPSWLLPSTDFNILIFLLIFITSLLLALDLICSSLSSFLKWKLGLLILDLFLAYRCIQCYKFSWVMHPTDTLLYFHSHLVQNIPNFCFRFLIWLMYYLEVCCLISKYNLL